MKFGPVPPAEAQTAILAHSLRVAGERWKKGRRLSAADIDRLIESGVGEVTVARLEAGDVGEDPAAAALAKAVAGAGLNVAAPFTGRVNLFAEDAGLLLIDRQRLDQINQVSEDLTVATLMPFSTVAGGQMVATVKVIPFAARRADLQRCQALAQTLSPTLSPPDAVLRVVPFSRRRAGLIQTRLPGDKDSVLDKTRRVMDARLAPLGAEVVVERRCDHRPTVLAGALAEQRRAGVDLMLIAGASAIVDRRDVIPAAIETAGGRVEHYGMPVDPGNLLLLGYLDATPVVGLPGCAKSPKFNGLDMVLPRLAAGIEVCATDIMTLGAGGLLKEIASRGEPRRRTGSAGNTGVGVGRASAPRVAALVLAAGQSRRMGEVNKLLLEIDGRPMLRGVVEQVLAARVDRVMVVTGHQRRQVEQVLAGCPVELVHNPDFDAGISTSLRAGLTRLGPTPDGALVVLGDMPGLRATHIDRLIAAFDPLEGRAVCVPTYHGKRGNPVLWANSYFPEIMELGGDSGAKHLLGEHQDAVCEVAFDDRGVLLDIDSPQALAHWRAGQR